MYYETRLRKLLVAGIRTADEMTRFQDVIDKATRGGRFDWSRWLAEPPDIQRLAAEYAINTARPSSPVQVKNVCDFVDALDSSVARSEPPPGVIKAAYALLCDVCHPAVGGWMLYARPGEPGWLSFGADPTDEAAAWFIG